MIQNVILVDRNDVQTGMEEKLNAHLKGLLHRAFSVFIFNANGEMLLQQRAEDKYHSGGLWTNACCSHPAPGEDTAAAAEMRLFQEMGIRTPVKKVFQFICRTELENGYTEHELDHVFTGTWSGTPSPDPAEVAAWKWISMGELEQELADSPAHFTYWFRLIMSEYHDRLLADAAS